VPPTPTPTNTEFPAPQANFTAGASPSDPFAFQFTNTSSGQIATYAWDFGDGGSSNEANPTHEYNAPGTYTVTLTVTDTIGRSSVFSGAVTAAEPINAGFSANATNRDVQFTDQSTGPVASWAWDFGDGGTSNEQNPLHSYAADGNYTVTLKVTTNDGRTDSETQPVSVATPIQANFSAQPNNLEVQFTDQSTGPVASWAWDFGDGGTSTEQNPLHPYGAAGTYTVTLTVSDAGGGNNTTSQQVNVSAPVQAAFAPQPNGLDVQFVDQSTGPIASWAWDFGDSQTSSEQNPLHTYAAEGTYTVTLTVSDAGGGSNSTSQQVNIAVPVQAGFSAQPDGLNVQFTDQSTGTITQWAWDFGDGTTSNEQNPLHTYAAAGSYTVTLVVTGSSGSMDDQSQMVDVAAPFEASFTAQPSDLNVQFTETSAGAVSWTWDFGDGNASNEQNPLHTYATEGSYTVTLTATDANGRSDDFSSEVTVTAGAAPTTPSQPSLVDSTPIQPDLSTLQPFLRPIYANGINTTGTRATVFAVAGDSLFVESGILTPFVSPSAYNLDSNTNLQAIIDWFNSTDLGGFTSFNRSSLAINPNWTAQDLLDPNQADPSCAGAAPLMCELQQTLPVMMFVSVGSNDAANGTDPATFQATLQQIIGTIAANGTIPVLMTVPDDGSSPNTAAINDAIIALAQANNVPVLNVARLLNELPSENLDASSTGAGDLSNSAVSEYGINAVNFRLLRLLLDARNIIFPDA
jgi:PKD repeat protein